MPTSRGFLRKTRTNKLPIFVWIWVYKWLGHPEFGPIHSFSLICLWLFPLNLVLLGMSVMVSCPSLTKSRMCDPCWENDAFLLDFSWRMWGSMDPKAAWRLAMEPWLESAFCQFPKGGFLEVVCPGRVLKAHIERGNRKTFRERDEEEDSETEAWGGVGKWVWETLRGWMGSYLNISLHGNRAALNVDTGQEKSSLLLWKRTHLILKCKKKIPCVAVCSWHWRT